MPDDSEARGFICDRCRAEHPEEDLGKSIGIEPHRAKDGEPPTECTGLLCKRCVHGDMNREQRRAQRPTIAHVCSIRCRP